MPLFVLDEAEALLMAFCPHKRVAVEEEIIVDYTTVTHFNCLDCGFFYSTSLNGSVEDAILYWSEYVMQSYYACDIGSWRPLCRA